MVSGATYCEPLQLSVPRLASKAWSSRRAGCPGGKSMALRLGAPPAAAAAWGPQQCRVLMAANSSRARAGPDPMSSAGGRAQARHSKVRNLLLEGAQRAASMHAAYMQLRLRQAALAGQPPSPQPHGHPATLTLCETALSFSGCAIRVVEGQERSSCARLGTGDAWQRRPVGRISCMMAACGLATSIDRRNVRGRLRLGGQLSSGHVGSLQHHGRTPSSVSQPLVRSSKRCHIAPSKHFAKLRGQNCSNRRLPLSGLGWDPTPTRMKNLMELHGLVAAYTWEGR